MKIRILRALKSIGQKIRLYYGLAETTKAIAVDRSVSHATSVVGDLATQTSNITRSDLEDILSADVSTVNPRLLNTTSGIVVSRVAYNYSPLKLRYLKTDFVLSDTFVLKPRKSALTLFDNQILKRYTCRSSGKNVSCS